MSDRMRITVLGLSITSSWGNGHATTYRALLRALADRGHDITFLERDVPWYADHRDMPTSRHWLTVLYRSLDELKDRHNEAVRDADLVIVGSYVPDGIEVGKWVTRTATGVTAFYDVDTPITIANLERGECEYLSADLIPRFDMYLSFTGGPMLRKLEKEFGSPLAKPLYCSFDPAGYFAEERDALWDLGYMGTYSDDRQPPLERLLLEPARLWAEGRFAVAGPMYPREIEWPQNVERIDHVPPSDHRKFYTSQRFTLNLTRSDMVKVGYSPSVRLFEAAACGAPIISDWWEGLDSLFQPGREILIGRTPEDVLQILKETPEAERLAIGAAARRRVMEEHTSDHRAQELEDYASLARKSGVPA